MIKRQDIIDCARTYLGTPFHHQGRLKGTGVDCIGLITGVASEFDMPYTDLSGYPRHPQGFTLLSEFGKNMTRIELDQMQPGDVAVFTMGHKDGKPRHAGIVSYHHPSKTMAMIHTWSSTRRVVEHVIDDKWLRRLYAAFLYPGVEPRWQP